LLDPLAISIWDLTTLAEHRPCDIESERFSDLVELRIGDSGRLLALYQHPEDDSERPSQVRVVTLPECKEVFSRQIPPDRARRPPALMMSSDGGRLGVYTRNGFDLWDTGDGVPYHIPSRLRRLPFALSPDGARIVTLDVDRSRPEARPVYRIIRVADGTIEEDIYHGVGSSSDPLEWIRPGLLVVRGWVDVNTDPPTYRAVPDAMPDDIALSPDGRLYASLNAPVLEVRNARTDALVAQTEVDGIDYIGFNASSDAVVATGVSARTVSTWLFRANGPYVTIPDSNMPERLDFDPESGALLAIGGEDIHRWKMPGPGSGNRPILLEPLPRPVVPSPPDPETSDKRTVAGRDVGRTGMTALIIQGNPRNGTRRGTRRYVELWLGNEMKNDLEVRSTLDSEMYGYVRFSGNDEFLILGERDGILLFKVPTLEAIEVNNIYHRGTVQGGVQSDGRRIVTMSSDLSIRVWDVATELVVSQLTAPRPYDALALSADGRWLAGLARDRTIDVWALAPVDLMAQACRWLEPPCP
jgi:WD40 repeat protein